jgi:hypothetical protein
MLLSKRLHTDYRSSVYSNKEREVKWLRDKEIYGELGLVVS